MTATDGERQNESDDQCDKGKADNRNPLTALGSQLNHVGAVRANQRADNEQDREFVYLASAHRPHCTVCRPSAAELTTQFRDLPLLRHDASFPNETPSHVLDGVSFCAVFDNRLP